MIYHYKETVQAGSGVGGDGTKANPWYWAEKTQGQIVDLNNENADYDDDYRLYLRVKLKAGTSYNIGQTPPGGNDGKIWLYDASGNWITSDDNDGATIAGLYCTDAFSYTPSTTGIYIIGAGNYNGETSPGDYKVAINPAPEADPVPSSGTSYTSSGFNELGKAIKYRSASIADCDAAKYPKEGLVFYAPLKKASTRAATGQIFYGTQNISEYTTKFGISCAKFPGPNCMTASDIGLPTGDSPSSICVWVCYDSLLDNWSNIVSYGANQGRMTGTISGNKFRTGGSGVNCQSTTTITAGKWYFVASTYNGSSGTVKTYINGTLENSASGPLNAQLENVYIGPDKTVTTYLAAARIYNRELSADEIAVLAAEFTPTT